MGTKRVLYVQYDPAQMVSRERLLMTAGHEVTTVLGTDGLLARRDVSAFDLILLGETASPDERTAAILWLKEQALRVPIVALCWPNEDLSQSDDRILLADCNAWFTTVATCLESGKDSP